jgi:hypothetical protein
VLNILRNNVLQGQGRVAPFDGRTDASLRGLEPATFGGQNTDSNTDSNTEYRNEAVLLSEFQWTRMLCERPLRLKIKRSTFALKEQLEVSDNCDNLHTILRIDLLV